MKLNQMAKAVTHTVLVFGPPKSGKTLLVGKLAEYFNLLWFDLEKGSITLTKLPLEWQQRIEVVRIPDSRTYPVGIETMMKVLKGSPCTVCDEHGKVDCALCKKNGGSVVHIHLNELTPDTIVVIDSGTQLTDSAIANICKDKDVEYKMQTDDWGNVSKYLTYCFSQLQNANYNLVMITHEAEVEMEDGKPKLVPSAGSRNFSRNTAKYFGHVVYVEVKNKMHKAASSTTFATNVLTGSRTDVVMEKDKETTLLRIFKPELFPEVEVSPVAVTQAQTSVDKLAALRAQMKK